MAALRHPAMDEFYFAEYPFKPDGGVEYFQKLLSYERYCLAETEADGDLRRYIGNLIDYAARHGQRPVFQFNRSLLRAGWLARNFSSVHVLVLRNPLAVWNSFRSLASGYFHAGICRILGQNWKTPPIKHLPAWLEFPREVRGTNEEESDYYLSFAKKNEDLLFPSFFDFYLLSTIHCAQHADCILDLDEITRNPAVRGAATSRLRDLGAEISLADCNLPSHVPQAGDDEWLAYEEFSRNFLASTLPPDISISKKRFETNAPLLSGHFRTLLAKFVERSSAGQPVAPRPAPGQTSDRYRLAIRLFESRQFELSAELFGAALADQPAAGELWNDWATAQNACRRAHLAELGFRLALRTDPPDREAAGNLGALLLSDGRFRDALPLLQAAELEASEETRPIVSQLVNRARESLGFCTPKILSPREFTPIAVREMSVTR
jgi:tetratricopeptide (TPR) repeat protein